MMEAAGSGSEQPPSAVSMAQQAAVQSSAIEKQAEVSHSYKGAKSGVRRMQWAPPTGVGGRGGKAMGKGCSGLLLKRQRHLERSEGKELN